jgi:hypothetical protein
LQRETFDTRVPLACLPGFIPLPIFSLVEGVAEIDLNDLHAYDPAAQCWTTPGILSGQAPSARQAAGLTVLSGSLYLFGGGGLDDTSESGVRGNLKTTWI